MHSLREQVRNYTRKDVRALYPRPTHRGRVCDKPISAKRKTQRLLEINGD